MLTPVTAVTSSEVQQSQILDEFDYKFTDTLPPQLQCNVTRDEYKHEESKRVSFGFIASFLNCG
ncbi:unnamed protein product, partial [Didymodactylos carnosus]